MDVVSCTSSCGLIRSSAPICSDEMVGPAGFEPATKGFTSVPMFPKGVDYLFTRAFRMIEEAVGCGTLLPVIKGTRIPLGA